MCVCVCETNVVNKWALTAYQDYRQSIYFLYSIYVCGPEGNARLPVFVRFSSTSVPFSHPSRFNRYSLYHSDSLSLSLSPHPYPPNFYFFLSQ